MQRLYVDLIPRATRNLLGKNFAPFAAGGSTDRAWKERDFNCSVAHDRNFISQGLKPSTIFNRLRHG
jgi:hypothetical protein